MRCNILVVDDDDVAVESIQRSVRKLDVDFNIVEAEDGAVALEILKGIHETKSVSEPLIVLLDLNMPRMNGFEFLQVIRSDDKLKSTVVFILTTSGSDVDRSKAYQENVAGYLIKDKVGPHFSKLFKFLDQYVSTVSLLD